MLKQIIAGACVALACAGATAADPFKLQVPMPADNDGAMAYIVNFDTGDKVDSTLVNGNAAVFSGQIDEPFLARVTVDGARYCQLILEPGSIAVDAQTRVAFGSPLNDKMRQVSATHQSFYGQYQNAATDDDRMQVEKAYDAAIDSIIGENEDNPIGYLLFLQQAYDLEPAALVAALEARPAFRKYTRISKLVEMNERRAATSEGARYIDFEVNGQKLSDFIGRDGKYVLVDYFASWCGPCKVQIKVLKEIYEKYKDSGKLDILGVAVWDDPDDTRRAIADEQIPWECIIDAGSVPTDIYGISGIPCIMLIAPDGIIVSRDKQGDELKAVVDGILAPAN